MNFSDSAYRLLRALYHASEMLQEQMEEDEDMYERLAQDLKWINGLIIDMERIEDAVNYLEDNGYFEDYTEEEDDE